MLHVFPKVCVCLQNRADIQGKLGVICVSCRITAHPEDWKIITFNTGLPMK